MYNRSPKSEPAVSAPKSEPDVSTAPGHAIRRRPLDPAIAYHYLVQIMQEPGTAASSGGPSAESPRPPAVGLSHDGFGVPSKAPPNAQSHGVVSWKVPHPLALQAAWRLSTGYVPPKAPAGIRRSQLQPRPQACLHRLHQPP